LQWGSFGGDAAANLNNFAGAATANLNNFAGAATAGFADAASGFNDLAANANTWGAGVADGFNSFGAGLADGFGNLDFGNLGNMFDYGSMYTTGSGIGYIVISVLSLIPTILFYKFWWSFKTEDTPVTRDNLVKAMNCYLIAHTVNFIGILVWCIVVGGSVLENRLGSFIPFAVLVILGFFWRMSAKAFAC